MGVRRAVIRGDRSRGGGDATLAVDGSRSVRQGSSEAGNEVPDEQRKNPNA